MRRSRDFLRMGVGIRDRYERCREWWEPHLRCTRAFLASEMQSAGSVAVLGAGRLFDIDLEGLRERFQTVTLFDADPSCRAEWKRVAGRDFGTRIFGEVRDLTEALEAWTEPLARAAARGDLRGYLGSLDAPVPGWSLEEFDAVISLNILGQIPLYWRDRVLAARPDLSEEEWGALLDSMGRLQVAHLQALTRSPAKQVAIVSDTEYYFYHVDETHWRVEPALFGEAKELFATLSSSAARGSVDTWLWHLAPQFIESDDEGEIHRVEACLLQR